MLAVMLAALFTRTISAAAAKTSLIVGPVAFYFINFVFFDEIQAWLKRLAGLDEPVHFLHLLAAVFVLTVVMMIVISRLRPARMEIPAAGDVAVDLTPWRFAGIAAVVIVFCTLTFYIVLAR
jgi:SSS family solute:Na+ symporter